MNSGLKMDLLWTNGGTTSTFAPQTISLDLSNYKSVYIIVKINTVYPQYQGFFIIKDSSIAYNLTGLNTEMKNIMRYRCIVSDGSIEFEHGYNSNAIDDDSMIPYRIYGVK